ncbi:MAG: hypothetical protein WBO77_00590 [Microgenomates group bacterium]
MRQKELLIISVTVFITIITWIIADIYHISTTQKIAPVETPAATMKTATIDTSILDVLQSKTDE